jgi:hypothetical protein
MRNERASPAASTVNVSWLLFLGEPAKPDAARDSLSAPLLTSCQVWLPSNCTDCVTTSMTVPVGTSTAVVRPSVVVEVVTVWGWCTSSRRLVVVLASPPNEYS